MSLPDRIPPSADTERLTSAAAALGYEIVDIAGFLDLVEEHAHAQTGGLNILKSQAENVVTANSDVRHAVETLAAHTDETVKNVEKSVSLVRQTGEQTRIVASWVQDISKRSDDVSSTLAAVKNNNQQIASIATQVNTLAINAKIEAARAGDAGRGFAVVAEAINTLSRQTREAAVEITKNIETITDWIAQLGHEAGNIAGKASDVIGNSGTTDLALGQMESSITSANEQVQRITKQAERVETAMVDFKPALQQIDDSVTGTTQGIEQTHERILRLIDTSETIVQSTALLSEHSEDGPFIRQVTQLSAQVSHEIERAIDEGRTSMSRVFDRNYRLIPNTNPEQFMTEYTSLLDAVLPPIQEPALEFDRRVVFCAAVDVNGYLPTHNKKFSRTPSDDPVWNTANCRNRRIFDDRVGLKAGRNKEPFLLQVYRRDMGGGVFKMMKDLSAPIIIQNRHWGGLRLAYSFE